MKTDIEIYDTTLRDGSQGEGISFSVQDKLRIAERLDSFGVHFIEGGWPGSNPKDIEFFREARTRSFHRARLAAFGSTRRKDLAVEDDPQVRQLLEAETPVVAVFGKTWLMHVKKILRAPPEVNLAMIADTVRCLKDHGRFVVYDAEHAFDGYKDDPGYAVATWFAARQAGADVVVLCDTNGGSLPEEVARITAAARARLQCAIGVHTHDDTGLGVANALAGVAAGAVHVQGTINGYGERTGNCNLTSLIPNVVFKLRRKCVPPSSLPQLLELSRFVDDVANRSHFSRQPWVGRTAFSHKGGTHVNAVRKLARSYEHIDPAAVGNTRNVLISELAGRSNIIMKARDLGIPLSEDSPHLQEILALVKDLEHQGYEFESATGSLAVLIRKILLGRVLPFEVVAYHVASRCLNGACSSQATVQVRVNDSTQEAVAGGDGPVRALDSALTAALRRFFPCLENVRLTDYKVRILDPSAGTAARTRVLIQSTDGEEDWGTVGVSGNIIEASLKALADSLVFCLLKKGSSLEAVPLPSSPELQLVAQAAL